MFTKHLLLLYTFYINYANIAWASTSKTNLKKYFGNKNKLCVLYLIKIDLHMPVHYLRL